MDGDNGTLTLGYMLTLENHVVFETEEEALPEGLPCGIEGLFGLEVGEDGHLYVTIAEGHEDLHFSIEDGHLKLQIGEQDGDEN